MFMCGGLSIWGAVSKRTANLGTIDERFASGAPVSEDIEKLAAVLPCLAHCPGMEDDGFAVFRDCWPLE